MAALLRRWHAHIGLEALVEVHEIPAGNAGLVWRGSRTCHAAPQAGLTWSTNGQGQGQAKIIAQVAVTVWVTVQPIIPIGSGPHRCRACAAAGAADGAAAKQSLVGCLACQGHIAFQVLHSRCVLAQLSVAYV